MKTGLASFLSSSLPLFILASAAPTVAATAPDTIAERAKPCLVCHAQEGRNARNEYYPRLAGKPEGYLFNQMVNFRDGRRKYRAMNLLLEPLPDAYLAELARYFAELSPRYTAIAAPVTDTPRLIRDGDAARKIPACVSCHGTELQGTTPAVPGLVGLPADYVSAQLGAWKVGTRRAASPDCMAEIAKRLDDREVSALAQWLAAQPLPAGAHAAPPTTTEAPLRCGSVPIPGGRP